MGVRKLCLLAVHRAESIPFVEALHKSNQKEDPILLCVEDYRIPI